MFTLGPINPAYEPLPFIDGQYIDPDASTDSGIFVSSSATETTASSTVDPHSTITPGPSTPTTGPTSTSAPSSTIKCTPFQKPAEGPGAEGCHCEGLEGDFPFLPEPTDGSPWDLCGYTTMPTHATTTVTPFTVTEENGEVVACASSTYYNYIVNHNAECAGATQVISTVSSIASSYAEASSSSAAAASSAAAETSAEAASSSAAAASTSWSAAAAAPSAECWILEDYGFFGESSLFQVYGINGWAGDDGYEFFDEESGCGLIEEFDFFDDSQDEFQGRMRDTQWAIFDVTAFKGGCIERAIISAGGPEISCSHGGPSDSYYDHYESKVKMRGVELDGHDGPAATWGHGDTEGRPSRIVDAPLAASRAVPRVF